MQMMDFPEGLINLYLTEIGEPSENSLRIVVAEGVLGIPSPIKIGNIDLGEGHPIELNSDSRYFEINWDDYVAYAVRNESFWKAEPNEPQMINHLYMRADSAFLEFVSTTTFADNDYPGPLRHWALSTLTHCVDVVSVRPPRVRQFNAKGG
ncbi:hypothetical protein WBP07_02385 [Novosphingobium sp. BL-8A]|uniref:hypothetical protein n=1 Tax=Novosphingobium sp. BL-8A TaxID=3127639 RepID=UPI003756CA14